MPRTTAAELDPEARPGRHRRLIIGLAVVFAAAAVAAGIAAARNGEPALTSRAWGEAPGFSLPSVREGEGTVSLERFQGRPVVLNFFASWCVPCQKELPAFDKVAQRTRGRVAFVGVTFNDDQPSARGMLDQTGVRYPAGFDARSKVATDYGLRGMPTTYFISAKGELLERAEKPLTEGQLNDILDRLFDV
jgi:cytochrome c biogenesis protein CcmG/thiol:disulfide interchange protein DsbE